MDFQKKIFFHKILLKVRNVTWWSYRRHVFRKVDQSILLSQLITILYTLYWINLTSSRKNKRFMNSILSVLCILIWLSTPPTLFLYLYTNSVIQICEPSISDWKMIFTRHNITEMLTSRLSGFRITVLKWMEYFFRSFSSKI